MEFKHISANMSSSPPPSKLLNIFWKARKLRKPNRAKVWTIPNSLTKKLKTKKQTCWLGLFFKEHHVYLWEYIGRGTKCEEKITMLYTSCVPQAGAGGDRGEREHAGGHPHRASPLRSPRPQEVAVWRLVQWCHAGKLHGELRHSRVI